MNPPTDPQVQIRRLFALKRHEQPPPGYFESLSDKVIARIEAQPFSRPVPWWRRWCAELAQQPLLASTYGILFAGLLVVAIGLAQSSESGEGPDPNLSHPVTVAPFQALSHDLLSTILPAPMDSVDPSTGPSSITPVLPLQGLSASPFQLPDSSEVERAAALKR